MTLQFLDCGEDLHFTILLIYSLSPLGIESAAYAESKTPGRNKRDILSKVTSH